MNALGIGRLGVAVVIALATAAVALSGAVPAAAPGKVTPKAGPWKVSVVKGGSGSGASGQFSVHNIAFSVSSNHKKVLHFAFSYDYSGPIKPPSGSCSGTGVSTAKKSSAIKNSKFSTPRSTPWTGGGSATFNGVFTSARKAHGTAVFSVFISSLGCQFSGMANSGTVTWRATR
jgi:hypothetical protein